MNLLIIAGGIGSRISHLHQGNKSLIKVHNLEVISHLINKALDTFQLKDIIITTNSQDVNTLKSILKKRFNHEFTILAQERPEGIPQAINLAKYYLSPQFIVQLGDFYSPEFSKFVKFATESKGSVLCLNKVSSPEKYGVLNPKTNQITEKPKDFISDLAVRGLYAYNHEIFELIPKLKKSSRGEFEITDLNNQLGFKTYEVKTVFDLGSEDGLLSFNRFLQNPV